MTTSGHGGKRTGAGRPKGTTKPPEQKTKSYTFRLYQWEVQTVRDFVKWLRKNNEEEQRPDIAEIFEKTNKLL